MIVDEALVTVLSLAYLDLGDDQDWILGVGVLSLVKVLKTSTRVRVMKSARTSA